MFTNIIGFEPKRSIRPESATVTIEQFDAESFNENEAGYIRNAISELSRATSKSQYDAIMAKLIQSKEQYNLDSKDTVESAISKIMPRYCQSPNEIQQYIELTNANIMGDIEKAYQQATKDFEAKKADEAPAEAPAE